jgi:TPR repeat protein
LRGRLTPTSDPDKAIFWWKRAADAGDVLSMSLIARFYEGQFGFPELRDVKTALDYYTKAAGMGNPAAMAALGSRLLSGEEKFRDEEKGRDWLKKAIDGNEFVAYLALGDYEENVKKNLKAALNQYERGKDAGQVECMLRVADFYTQGKGVDKDVERGVSILRKAAESGNPIASFRLATQALSEEKPNLPAGYGYLLAAANGNLLEAQNELALLYLSGKMGAADPTAGLAWLTRAAQGGFAQAQYNLAVLYDSGAGGVARNIGNAGQLYTLAANQGHGPATLALARLVNEGIGTKSEPTKAWAIATLAAERGMKEAPKFAAEIADKFDSKQREEANKELQNLKSNKPAEAVPATNSNN